MYVVAVCSYRFWNMASLMATVPISGTDESLDVVLVLVGVASFGTLAAFPVVTAVCGGLLSLVDDRF